RRSSRQMRWRPASVLQTYSVTWNVDRLAYVAFRALSFRVEIAGLRALGGTPGDNADVSGSARGTHPAAARCTLLSGAGREAFRSVLFSLTGLIGWHDHRIAREPLRTGLRGPEHVAVFPDRWLRSIIGAVCIDVGGAIRKTRYAAALGG